MTDGKSQTTVREGRRDKGGLNDGPGDYRPEPPSALKPRTTDWQPIETAPRDGSEVLAFEPGSHGGRKVVMWVDSSHNRALGWSGHWELTTSSAIVHPTHWMPLLEPPHE